MADNIATVEQAYEDFAKGDVPAVLAVLDERVEWNEAEGNPWWPGGPIVGHQQVVEQVFARVVQDFEGFAIDVARVVGCGDTVLVQARYSGTSTSTGRPLDAQVAHVWDFTDGKAVRFQQYVNTAHLQDVLGATP
jgi:ketosteroid isomerase-like protein